MYIFVQLTHIFRIFYLLARGNTFPKFLTVLQLPMSPIGLTDQGDMGSKVQNAYPFKDRPPIKFSLGQKSEGGGIVLVFLCGAKA